MVYPALYLSLAGAIANSGTLAIPTQDSLRLDAGALLFSSLAGTLLTTNARLRFGWDHTTKESQRNITETGAEQVLKGGTAVATLHLNQAYHTIYRPCSYLASQGLAGASADVKRKGLENNEKKKATNIVLDGKTRRRLVLLSL